MINMTLTEFLDLMYDGQEIVFSFHDKIYNFEISDNLINIYQLFDDKDGIELLAVKYDKATYYDQITSILEKPLFDGKTLYDIETEVKVLSNS